MKKIVAGGLTLAVLALLLWRASGSTASVATATPQECVERMFLAAARGDAVGYLDCFAPDIQERLKANFSRSPGGMSAALQESVAGLKGWALVDPPASTDLPNYPVTVEWVYATRIDRQRLTLERSPGGWKITQADRVESGQPIVPYGTPIQDTGQR